MSGDGGGPVDVLVAGDLFVDMVMSGFGSWPPNPGEEIFAERFCREIGGGAAITACGMARLGAKVGVAWGGGKARWAMGDGKFAGRRRKYFGDKAKFKGAHGYHHKRIERD